MMKRLVQRLRNTEAAEIAEAALVLPVVFVFLLGIVWFGRAFNIYSTIQQAAQQGAIAAARPTCASCSSGTTTGFPSDQTVTNAIFAVMQASSLDPSQIVTPNKAPVGCTNSQKVTICREMLLNPSSNPAQSQNCQSVPTPSQLCGTIVTFQYPFKFPLPFTSLNFSPIALTAQAQTRTEN
jgi:Flp pilus assembly protein TadG